MIKQNKQNKCMMLGTNKPPLFDLIFFKFRQFYSKLAFHLSPSINRVGCIRPEHGLEVSPINVSLGLTLCCEKVSTFGIIA